MYVILGVGMGAGEGPPRTRRFDVDRDGGSGGGVGVGANDDVLTAHTDVLPTRCHADGGMAIPPWTTAALSGSVSSDAGDAPAPGPTHRTR